MNIEPHDARCPVCGSVFRRDHVCHALPAWIGLAVCRARRRRHERS